MNCDSRRDPVWTRSRGHAAWVIVLLASLAMPQAILAQSGKTAEKTAETEKRASAAKTKAAHTDAKSDAAPKNGNSNGKPKAVAPVVVDPATAAAPNALDATSAEPRPGGDAVAPTQPVAAPPDAAKAPRPDPTAEPSGESPRPAANEFFRERSGGLLGDDPHQPAAEPPRTTPSPVAPQPATPSLAGSSQTPIPADTTKPPAAEVKPQPAAPAGDTAAPANPAEGRPGTASEEAAPAGGAPPQSGPAEETSEPQAEPAPGPTSVPPAAVAPAACNRAGFRVAIDVGHTETNYGAVSAHGKPEFEYNRRLAQELVTNLWKDGFQRAEVVIQTDSDLQRRARDLSSRRPNLMLSLHHDSVQDKYLTTGDLDGQRRTFTRGFEGYSIFISRDNAYLDDSERFARMLGAEMRAQGLKPTFHHHEQENRQIFDPQGGVFFYDGLVVLKQTTAPATLLESAVITDIVDESKADDPRHRQHIVDAITNAIINFCDAGAAHFQHAPPSQTPPATQKPASPEKQGSRK